MDEFNEYTPGPGLAAYLPVYRGARTLVGTSAEMDSCVMSPAGPGTD